MSWACWSWSEWRATVAFALLLPAHCHAGILAPHPSHRSWHAALHRHTCQVQPGALAALGHLQLTELAASMAEVDGPILQALGPGLKRLGCGRLDLPDVQLLPEGLKGVWADAAVMSVHTAAVLAEREAMLACDVHLTVETGDEEEAAALSLALTYPLSSEAVYLTLTPSAACLQAHGVTLACGLCVLPASIMERLAAAVGQQLLGMLE